MSDRDRLIEAATQEIVAGGWPRAQATVILDALTASPELAGVLARWAAEQAGSDMGDEIAVVAASAFDAVVAERDAAEDRAGEMEERIAALEEAGDALAAAALGADRQVAAWRAVRNREVAA